MTAGACASNPADGQPERVTPRDAAQLPTAPRLALGACDICNQPLLARKACAVVDLAAAARRAARMRRWYEEGQPPPVPQLIAWRLVHLACDPDLDLATSFVIGASLLKTDRALLKQSVRVSRQPWYRQTAWPTLVARIIELNPRGG
jgi:hypothetical protein